MSLLKNDTELTLAEVSDLLYQLRLPTQLVFTPVNLREEKSRFMESDTYNPQFRYEVVDNNNANILKKLKKVRYVVDVPEEISKFYIKLIHAKSVVNEMMQNVGDNETVSELSAKLYKRPTSVAKKNASMIIRGKVKKYSLIDNTASDLSKGAQAEDLGFEDIKRIFNDLFAYLGLDGWEVSEGLNMEKSMLKVGTKTKKVITHRDIRKSPMDLRKAIVHEVFTHVLRSVNGGLSGYDALSRANLHSYLPVEEGLATYNEERYGVLSFANLKKKAIQLYAVSIGRTMSFRQLFDVLKLVESPTNAFYSTYRVKRGLSDTSKPGIYAKDHVYMTGFWRVRKRLVDDPTLYEKLYAGKIGWKQVKWVDKGWLPMPKYLPPSIREAGALWTRLGI